MDENTPIEIKYFKCNKIFKRKFTEFKVSINCSLCIRNAKISFETVIEFINNTGHKLLTKKKDYKNVRTKLDVECKDCHKIFHPTFTEFKNFRKRNCNSAKTGTRCPYCANKAKYTLEIVKQFIEQNNLYELSSKEYKNSKSKLEIKCLKCQELFKMTFDHFKNQLANCNFILNQKAKNQLDCF